jgi:fumarate reductase subunit C
MTQEMITTSTNQNYQFLGAQILHQKIEKEIISLPKPSLAFLKQFLFSQFTVSSFNLPTIRKITTSAALIAVVSCLEDWPTMFNDIV